MPWLWLCRLLVLPAVSMDLKAKGGLFMCAAGAGILMVDCDGRELPDPACLAHFNAVVAPKQTLLSHYDSSVVPVLCRVSLSLLHLQETQLKAAFC